MDDLFDRIMEAHTGIRPQVLVTPLDYSVKLSQAIGAEVLLKLDHLQPTGSFKARGSANKIRVLGEAAKATGVITASTGNHGQGVARACHLAGVAATVYVCTTTPPAKIRAIQSWGAEVVVFDGPALGAELEARRQAGLQNKPYVPPYNDFDIMAGQGTMGVELCEQAPDLDAVFVCVGGGGLAGGLGTAVKRLSPKTRVVGVWPKASTCMLDSIRAGHIVETPEFDTLSEASMGAIEPGSVTFAVCQQVIDDTLTVSEVEIARAMRAIAESDRWMVEGTAGVALAGLIQVADAWQGKKVAIIVCGRNIALDTFMGAMELAKTGA